MMGTLQWEAPELFVDEKVHYSDRTDVYSLGVIYWEIAAQKRPYEDYRPAKLMAMHAVHKSEPEKIPENCPKEFAQIINQCRERQPEKRSRASEITTELSALQRLSIFGGVEIAAQAQRVAAAVVGKASIPTSPMKWS